MPGVCSAQARGAYVVWRWGQAGQHSFSAFQKVWTLIRIVVPQVYVRKRPHVEYFMNQVSQLFEIIVFTASQARGMTARKRTIERPFQNLMCVTHSCDHSMT